MKIETELKREVNDKTKMMNLSIDEANEAAELYSVFVGEFGEWPELMRKMVRTSVIDLVRQYNRTKSREFDLYEERMERNRLGGSLTSHEILRMDDIERDLDATKKTIRAITRNLLMVVAGENDHL